MKKISFLIVLVIVFSLSGFAQNFTSDDTICITDAQGVSLTSSIFVEGYNANQIVTQQESEFLKICANLEHSFVSDIWMYIQCPNGQQAEINYYSTSNPCAGNYFGEPDHADDCNPGVGYNYCWTMNASQSHTDWCDSLEGNIPSGDYLPTGTFDDLTGCPLNGEWSLVFVDDWGADDGTLFGWSIDFLQDPFNNGLLEGYVFSDINANNVYDPDVDYPMPNTLIKAEPGPYYGISDTAGKYHIWVDTINYVVTSLLDEEIWNLSYPTDSSYSVSVEMEDTISGLDFAYIADTYCPDLEVDINLYQIMLCQQSHAHISYQNNGTLVSDSTTITVELDDYFEYVSGGNLISQDGNTLTFGVDTVLPGQSGSFIIALATTCDIDFMGATACVEANIYPDEPCMEPDPEWDHSSVAVDGECVGDSLVCFTITNTGDPGDGDMSGPSEYRLFEDNIIVETGTFQLVGGETTEMCWTATGTTLRLEADQHPAHPGNSHPQESIELCGNPNGSTGEILGVPQDDQDDFAEIDCQEILGSLDPNDKSVVPQGLTEHHYIDSTNVLEYKIRFQNTGTAPAQKVVITDTISEYLDMATFNPMGTSHPCEIDFPLPNVIRWTFEGINLPDSGANEPESHGFVKFKMHQQAGNQIYTEITNSAAIFFDYNLPVLTNEVFNIIGKMNQVITEADEINTQQQVEVFPNPAANYVKFSVNADKYDIELYDASGRIIRHIQGITSAEYSMPATNISHGIYYYRIKDKDGVIGAGKLVITE